MNVSLGSLPVASLTSHAPASISPAQRKALAHLHTAATQLEGVFLGMMLKEMRASVPTDSLFGSSPTEETFTGMLDEQRAQAMASTGSLGVAKIMEQQLRASVLSDPEHESSVQVPTQGML